MPPSKTSSHRGEKENSNMIRSFNQKNTYFEKKLLYNKWHKELYQPDFNRAFKRYAKLNKFIISLLNINSNSNGKLLDIACGKGIHLKAFREFNKNLKIYGSDISNYAISIAKKSLKH